MTVPQLVESVLKSTLIRSNHKCWLLKERKILVGLFWSSYKTNQKHLRGNENIEITKWKAHIFKILNWACGHLLLFNISNRVHNSIFEFKCYIIKQLKMSTSEMQAQSSRKKSIMSVVENGKLSLSNIKKWTILRFGIIFVLAILVLCVIYGLKSTNHKQVSKK